MAAPGPSARAPPVPRVRPRAAGSAGAGARTPTCAPAACAASAWRWAQMPWTGSAGEGYHSATTSTRMRADVTGSSAERVFVSPGRLLPAALPGEVRAPRLAGVLPRFSQRVGVRDQLFDALGEPLDVPRRDQHEAVPRGGDLLGAR